MNGKGNSGHLISLERKQKFNQQHRGNSRNIKQRLDISFQPNSFASSSYANFTSSQCIPTKYHSDPEMIIFINIKLYLLVTFCKNMSVLN